MSDSIVRNALVQAQAAEQYTSEQQTRLQAIQSKYPEILVHEDTLVVPTYLDLDLILPELTLEDQARSNIEENP